MRLLAIAAVGLLALAPVARAQTTPPGAMPGAPSGTMLLTIVFRHDQSKPLPEINAELKRVRAEPDVFISFLHEQTKHGVV